MNLVRHDLGFSKTESRFPTKGTCLAIYSRCVNAEMPIDEVLGQHFPWCAGWAARIEATVRGLCRSQAAAERSRLRRSSALLGADGHRSGARRGDRRPLRPCDGRRISGHQPPAVLDPAGAKARRARAHRGRRRRAIDLFVPRRHCPQHPGLSRRSSVRRPRSSRSTATTARRNRSCRPPMA